MRTYKCLFTNHFTYKDFSLVPIRNEDKYIIMKTRNEQMFHLRQQQPLTESDQETYFKNTISELFLIDKPNQLLFSFLTDGEFVGYGGLVHIDWEQKSAEISFIMLTELEKDKFSKNWTVFLKLIEAVAFEVLKFNKIYTYAYDLRPHLYSILELAGYNLTQRLINEVSFQGNLVDVLIHTKPNPYIYFRNADIEDLDLTYKWANDITVRQNSFNPNPISYKDHCQWFTDYLKSERINIFIFYDEYNIPIGITRFQQKNDFESVISVSVDSNYRGKGIAKKIIRFSSNYYRAIYDNFKILAYIKIENLASIKSFIDAGYTEVGSDLEYGFKFIL